MYPQRLYRTPGPDDIIVNSDAEKASALKSGYTDALPAKDEFPKVVYLHPVDKTQEHTYIVVKNPAELTAAQKDGYQIKPHIPVTDSAYEGSGSERWGHGAWTETQGRGLNADTHIPTQAEADTVAHKAAAEMAARNAELASEGKPGANEGASA